MRKHDACVGDEPVTCAILTLERLRGNVAVRLECIAEARWR